MMLVQVNKDNNLVELGEISPGSVFEYDLLYYIKSTYDEFGGQFIGCVELTSGEHNVFKHGIHVRPVENAKVVIG